MSPIKRYSVTFDPSEEKAGSRLSHSGDIVETEFSDGSPIAKYTPSPYNELTEELSALQLQTEIGEESNKLEEYAPDGGWGWVIVFASLMNNFVLDGVAFSYGVLTAEIKRASNGVVGDVEFNLCGGVMLGVTLLVGPLVSILIRPFGFRLISIVGSLLASLGFLVSWAPFTEVPNFWSIFFGFGILSGIGFGFMFTTSIVIVGLYFDRNRPLATGIAVTGSAVGSIVMPFIIKGSTDYWGWQGSMITLAVISLISALFGALYRPLPKRLVQGSNTKEHSEDLSSKKTSDFAQVFLLLSSPTYWILAVSGGITVLGYFVPSALLTDRAETAPFNATRTEGTVLLTYTGISNTIGRVVFGIMANSDRAKYAFIFTNGAITIGGLATILSAYATKYYQLIVYAVFYGQVIAVYGSLRSIIIMDFLGEEKFNVGFGLSLFFMGVASFFGNVLAAWLYEMSGNHDLSFKVAGGLFVFSAVICYPLRWIQRKEKDVEEKSGRRWASAMIRRVSNSQP